MRRTEAVAHAIADPTVGWQLCVMSHNGGPGARHRTSSGDHDGHPPVPIRQWVGKGCTTTTMSQRMSPERTSTASGGVALNRIGSDGDSRYSISTMG